MYRFYKRNLMFNERVKGARDFGRNERFKKRES